MDSMFTTELSAAPRFTTAPRPMAWAPKAKSMSADAFPGPGAYKTENSSFRPNGVRIGSSRRWESLWNHPDVQRYRSSTPGPAAYRVDDNAFASTRVKGGVIAKARSRSAGLTIAARDTEIPGPAAYSISRDCLDKKGVKIPTAARTTELRKAVSDSPGPGAYTPTAGAWFHAPASFGKQKRQCLKNLEPKETTPGPCAYRPEAAVDSAFHAPATFPKQKRECLKNLAPKETTPGPCAYRPEAAVETWDRKSGSFGRADRALRSLLNTPRDTTPGPGDYNPKWTKESRHTKMH